MPDQAALLGTWRMVLWKREIVATGEQTDAVGPDPVGYTNYGADGRFYALVVSRDRPGPASLPPSANKKIRLFDSMLAYTGTYTLDDEKAVHHLDASWNQAWTGTDQVRFYKLDGDRLTITRAPAKDPYTGQDIIYRIGFERVLSSPLGDTVSQPDYSSWKAMAGHLTRPAAESDRQGHRGSHGSPGA